MTSFKPDEGRAWVVLVACFLGVGIITDGIGVSFFSAHIYKVFLLENASNRDISWQQHLHHPKIRFTFRGGVVGGGVG